MKDKFDKIEEIDDKEAIRRMIDKHLHNNIKIKDVDEDSPGEKK